MQHRATLGGLLMMALVAGCGDRGEFRSPTAPRLDTLPLAVHVQGYSYGVYNCEWDAIGTGGTGPYTFVWTVSRVSGRVLGGDGYYQAFAGTFRPDLYTIAVKITDRNGLTASASYYGETSCTLWPS